MIAKLYEHVIFADAADKAEVSEVGERRAVARQDDVEAPMQLVQIILAEYTHALALTHRQAEPRLAERGGHEKLKHQQAFADATITGE